MNIEGSATNEAVLLDQETVEWMSQMPAERGQYRPRIFGHTKEVNLLMMQIEVATGKPMKRPYIPGLELRTQKVIVRTKDAIAAAQERARKKKLEIV